MKQTSNCCNDSVRVVGGDEGTNHWECTKCGKACDISGNNYTDPNYKSDFDRFSKAYLEGQREAYARVKEIANRMKRITETEFDVGSEFSTPRLIRANGFNDALQGLIIEIEKAETEL